MQYENNLEKLKAQKGLKVPPLAVKGDRVTYFKETEKDRLLTFNRMWVNVVHTIPQFSNFDFITVI